MKNKATQINRQHSVSYSTKIKKNTSRRLLDLVRLQEKRILENAMEFSRKTYELLCLTSENQLENIKH